MTTETLYDYIIKRYDSLEKFGNAIKMTSATVGRACRGLSTDRTKTRICNELGISKMEYLKLKKTGQRFSKERATAVKKKAVEKKEVPEYVRNNSKINKSLVQYSKRPQGGWCTSIGREKAGNC